jgi:hypothetical protein
MAQKTLLAIDAAMDLALGILLSLTAPLPERLPRLLGLPPIGQPFYSSLLGAVLTGIGAALLIERRRYTAGAPVGLGTMGAIAINLCGGIALLGWLLWGGLELHARGTALLWTIDALVLGVSALELAAQRRTLEP